MSDVETDWRAVAREYRSRLLGVCWWTAFAAYLSAGLALGKLLEYARVSDSWTETIAMFAWAPLGGMALWMKIRLERWASKDLPCP